MTADYDEALVEKAARALSAEGADPGSSIHSWRCEYPDQYHQYGACDCVQEVARAVLRAVADDLRAEGVTAKHGACICNTGPGTDGPDEFCPHHGRTYAEILAGWERDYALAKSGFDAEARAAREAEAEREAAYRRGQIDGARQVLAAVEQAHREFPAFGMAVGRAREALDRIERGEA